MWGIGSDPGDKFYADPSDLKQGEGVRGAGALLKRASRHVVSNFKNREKG
jgi:hypothetical protein